MLAPPIGIIVELAAKIAGIETGETRAGFAVAFAFEAVAGEAGGRGAAIAAAECNRLAGRAKAVVSRRRAASREEDEQEEESGAHLAGTIVGARWFPKRSA